MSLDVTEIMSVLTTLPAFIENVQILAPLTTPAPTLLFALFRTTSKSAVALRDSRKTYMGNVLQVW